jgi:uncharacterized protein YndB with AHSA1/START domain
MVAKKRTADAVDDAPRRAPVHATGRSSQEKLPELTISRTLDAPVDLVFRMWTDGEHLRNWCCPTGMTIPFSEGDIRPGGAFRSCMRAPDGAEYWLRGTYREIVPNERLVFTHAWLDEAGNPKHETVVTVTFAESGDGSTRLTLHQSFFLTGASRDGHRDGWNETFDNLAEYLST